MAQNHIEGKADVRIEGPVAGHHSVDYPSLRPEDALTIHTIEVMTNSTGKKEDAMFHRIAIVESEETDKATRTLLSRIGAQDPGTIYVSLKGELAETVQDGLMIKARSISESTRKKMSSSAEISGVIKKIIPYKDGYTASLSTPNPIRKEKLMSVSFVIGNKADPETVRKIAEGKINEGDTLKVKGSLLSQTMWNGQRRFNFCSVKADNAKVLRKAQEQTRKTRAGRQTI